MTWQIPNDFLSVIQNASSQSAPSGASSTGFGGNGSGYTAPDTNLQPPSPAIAPQPTLSGSSQRKEELDQQNQAAHQNALDQGYLPIPGQPGSYIHQNDLSPNMLAYYQQQAAQLYPSNPLGNSKFAQSRAGGVLGNLLIAGSQARPGATVADSIGVASRMALAPSQYAQDVAQERASYVTGQVKARMGYQKDLAEINDANARSNYYGAQSDYLSGAKTDAAYAKVATDKQNADTRNQSVLAQAKYRQDVLNQKQSQFEDSEIFKRWQTQFKAANAVSRQNQLDMTERAFQTHIGQLQKDMLAKVNGKDPLTGGSLSPAEQEGIRQSYIDEISAETAAHNSLKNWASQQPAPPKTQKAPIDLGPANGKPEGSTGTLNGKPVVVRNGRIVSAN